MFRKTIAPGHIENSNEFSEIDNLRFKHINLLTLGCAKQEIVIQSGNIEFLSPIVTEKGFMAFQEELGLKEHSLTSIYKSAGIHKMGLKYINPYGYLNNVNIGRMVALIRFLNNTFADKYNVSLGLDMHDPKSSEALIASPFHKTFFSSITVQLWWMWLGVQTNMTLFSENNFPATFSNLIPSEQEFNQKQSKYLFRIITNGLLQSKPPIHYDCGGGVVLRALRKLPPTG